MMGDDGSGFTYTEQYNTNYEFTDDFQTRQPMQPTTFQNTNTQTSSAQASQAAKTQAAKAQASKPAPKPEQPKSVAKPEPPKAAPPKPEPPKPVAKPEPPKPVAKPEPPKPVVKPEPPKAAPPKPEPPKPEPPKPEPPKPTPTPKNETTQQVTKEDKINIPQVKYVQLDQFKSGTFELPIVRRASVTKGSTVENTVIIPQIGFVDLCQDHPTTEHEVNLITVHTVTVQQIVPTNECDVELIQVHTVWIPIMGDINIVQHRTKSRRVHLKQEWDCSIKCEDTRIHFLQLPQRDEGIKGTVVVSGTQDDSKSCYSCHSSKCAGVGPALLPIFMDETTPVSRPAPVVQAPKPAPPPKPEIQYVEVIKEVCTKAPEPTEIHHITLGMCPCQEQTVAAPLMFAEQTESTAYAGAFKWWMFPLILLGLLLLSMLLAWLLCLNRNKVEKVQVEKKPESPQKKFIIEKKTKEEDEEEIEREIARTLQARVEANKREQVPAPVVREEEKKVEVKQQVPAAAKQEAAPAAAQDANRALQESPGGSQNSEGRQRSSRGSGSSKKVVKKRIVKMMKQGKLVAEKEEILDEEGNVIRTEIRKEGLSSGSPNRSQP